MKKIMFLTLLITALCLFFTIAHAQWLETTITVGNIPYALVWNSINNKVYCANVSSNSVTVIDGQTNSVITTITAGSEPHALVWNSQNNKIYCANGSNSVTVIDGQTNSVITTITVGSEPYALVWNSQNNRIYCTNSASNNVTVIDGQTNSVITTIAVGSYPSVLVWNSQNNKIYCANDSSNNVTVINGQTNSVITTIAVGNYPFAFCWNPFQNRVYVANFYSSSLSVIRDSIVSGVAEAIENCKLKIDNFSVYSNPAKTFFTIRLPQTACRRQSGFGTSATDRSTIRIYDVSGKAVKELDSFGVDELRVSLDGIKSGVYFVQFGAIIKKLTITK